ncbi:hypothetical protein NDU88_001483 [Pleurodeles waltl]|uniref:Uncharacterized protein n=1 Tax=Pleurodeles waltl TaxID=8319 RepID=A0AAV7THS7_PLEWA|nr:hypothetical protein NDU88_001483 [Pleurodeles waltl]
MSWAACTLTCRDPPRSSPTPLTDAPAAIRALADPGPARAAASLGAGLPLPPVVVASPIPRRRLERGSEAAGTPGDPTERQQSGGGHASAGRAKSTPAQPRGSQGSAAGRRQPPGLYLNHQPSPHRGPASEDSTHLSHFRSNLGLQQICSRRKPTESPPIRIRQSIRFVIVHTWDMLCPKDNIKHQTI